MKWFLISHDAGMEANSSTHLVHSAVVMSCKLTTFLFFASSGSGKEKHTPQEEEDEGSEFEDGNSDDAAGVDDTDFVSGLIWLYARIFHPCFSR